MDTKNLPAWFVHLEDEDQHFIKRLVLASGSLKEMAENYEVSYPTIRLRLDGLIERIRIVDDVPPNDTFQAKIRLLVADGEMSLKTGKELLQVYNESSKRRQK